MKDKADYNSVRGKMRRDEDDRRTKRNKFALVVKTYDKVLLRGCFDTVAAADRYILKEYPNSDVAIIRMDKYRDWANGKGFFLRFYQAELAKSLEDAEQTTTEGFQKSKNEEELPVTPRISGV